MVCACSLLAPCFCHEPQTSRVSFQGFRECMPKLGPQGPRLMSLMSGGGGEGSSVSLLDSSTPLGNRSSTSLARLPFATRLLCNTQEKQSFVHLFAYHSWLLVLLASLVEDVFAQNQAALTRAHAHTHAHTNARELRDSRHCVRPVPH